MATMTQMLSVVEAARECGLSGRRIRALLAQGRIEGAVKVGGYMWLIPSPVKVLPPPSRGRK